MNIRVPIEYDSYYHIFNRGVNGTTVFFEEENYLYFLKLYSRYIEPVAETFAWVLLKNHFHILLRIKDENEIDYIKPNERNKDIKYPNRRKYVPSRQFAHFFNAYTRGINKKYARTGNIFERSFKRIKITGEEYFKNLTFYIHNNPVHHKFVENLYDYKWSSIHTILSEQSTKLNRQKIFEWFNSKEEFIEFHRYKQNFENEKKFVIE